MVNLFFFFPSTIPLSCPSLPTSGSPETETATRANGSGELLENPPEFPLDFPLGGLHYSSITTLTKSNNRNNSYVRSGGYSASCSWQGCSMWVGKGGKFVNQAALM